MTRILGHCPINWHSWQFIEPMTGVAYDRVQQLEKPPKEGRGVDRISGCFCYLDFLSFAYFLQQY